MLYIRTLSDIQCFFTSKSENASYRINYYNTGSKVSTNLPSPSVGFSIQDLIETSNSFSGKLEHKSALVVIGIIVYLCLPYESLSTKPGLYFIFIVVTPIPKFLNTEEETGSLLLACKSSNSQRIFQSSLGSVRLSFSDVSSQNMNFNPSVIGKVVKNFSFEQTVIRSVFLCRPDDNSEKCSRSDITVDDRKRRSCINNLLLCVS